jgi:dolichol-phosphate mannosyltransferase
MDLASGQVREFTDDREQSCEPYGPTLMTSASQIAVVVPCFRVRRHVLDVIRQIGPEVRRIYAVDDCCPDNSGDFIKQNNTDDRVIVIRHTENQGVGGAVMTGYKAAIDDGMDIIVKVDGDGQMDPALIGEFTAPIERGMADYTKGNRFFDLEEISAMPKSRIFGNAVLSFMTKFSSGYWDLFDPTNGFTAIHRNVARHLPFKKISRRYFFETDMLFRLGTLRAVVVDIPMSARYGDEASNLKISKVIWEFPIKHARNFAKRIFYNYYLRGMSLASIELPVGLASLVFGLLYGMRHWLQSTSLGVPTPAGTVMLSALPVVIGLQLVLSFLGHDIESVPRRPFHQLKGQAKTSAEQGVQI